MTADDLIALRNRMNWTQAQAAAALGCSLRSIANWESGATTIPDSIALAASAAIANLPKYGDDMQN